MSFFKDIALPTAALGIPVTPLRPNTKDAFLPGFQNSATTDPAQIEEWDRQYPNSNCGAIAKASLDGVWMFEVDDPAYLEKIKVDTGKDIMDTKTYMVRSRQGRGHIYFHQTPLSIQMGNVPQVYGPFSCRVNNMYVVAAGSMHPNTGIPYQCLTPGVAPQPAPDWFVQWIISQRDNAKIKGEDAPRTETGKVPHGFIHGWLVTTAGRLRSAGLSGQDLEDALLATTHDNCEEPIDDEKVKQVAKSFEKYETNPTASLILGFNQKPDEGIAAPTEEDIELPVFDPEAYPVFPEYVWSNTSLYENFVKPVCDHNSRIPYFMWLPAMTLLLNYLGTKISVKGQFAAAPLIGSQYLVLIGKRGETHKSFSIDDAMEYFKYMGCLSHDAGVKTAEGKSIVWTAGSMEGLGIDMQKTNTKNAILFFDELSQLTKKAGIDGSTMTSNLLTMYESKKFGNKVKEGKGSYSLEPNSYVFSLLSCCTDETFTDIWSKMSGNDTGLNDRFFFALQPKELPKQTLKIDVPYLEKSVKTRQLIDKAVQQGVFEVENWNNPKLQALVPIGSRYAQRAMKWALALAVDLGLSVIDDECVDRGCDITRYEIAVKNYLRSYDAHNREAALQMRMRQKLELNQGKMTERELKRVCHFDREGTSAWSQAFFGLLKSGIIRVLGQGTKNDPRVVQVLIKRDIEDGQ